MQVTVVILLALIAGLALTRLVWWYADNIGLLDRPNERSSHQKPTPKGGGIAIVVPLMLACLWFAVERPELLLLVGLLVVLTVLGWFDDHHELAVRPRLAIQFSVCLVAILIWGAVKEVDFGPLHLNWAVLMWPLTLLFMVWFINLYNFMDGIDGIAGVESLTGGLTLAVWFRLSGQVELSLICLTVAGATLGFLFYNWSPAKIFLGDTGSVTLGGFFVIMGLIGANEAGISVLAFMLLFGVFIFDATVTLARRWWRGEKLSQAHRSHFYQHAVQKGYTHAQVSTSVLALNIILAMLASLVFTQHSFQLLWFLTGLVLLGVTAFFVSRLPEINPQ